MTVGLFGTDKVELNIIADFLKREELSVTICKPRPQLQKGDLSGEITQAALIIPESGVVSIGDQTSMVRQTLAPHISLILCTSQITAEDRDVLLSCGASAAIKPQSWAPKHVAERILAQLILDKVVLPNASGPLKGATRLMHKLYDHIQTLARLSDPVLIVGETGTGKELVAQELHNRSERTNSFFPINCPEIGHELMNSELFGHEKGAFTNAIQSRKGLLIAAGKGTVFLDEIGDLDLAMQAKLLRVLEERKVRPVGSNHWEEIQARIVMSTNRDLDNACAENRFRIDLYHRMKGFTLAVPPLRERKADIPLLVDHFVNAFSKEYNKPLSVPDGALDSLFSYEWPGNVRELRSVIRRAAAFADRLGNISTLILQESVRGRTASPTGNSVSFDPTVDSWPSVRKRVHKVYFNAVLASTKGNKEAAIKLSGLSRTQFYDNLRRLEDDAISDED